MSLLFSFERSQIFTPSEALTDFIHNTCTMGNANQKYCYRISLFFLPLDFFLLSSFSGLLT